MEGIARMVSDHPLMAMAIGFAVLLIVYFLFKSLVKLVLIAIIVAVLIGAYFHFQRPESRPADIREAIERAKVGAGEAVNRGKQVYKAGKETYEKGRELVEKGKVVLDKGLDQGKEAVEKGTDAAGKIGNTLKGDKEAGR
jgi:hypothetical protein